MIRTVKQFFYGAIFVLIIFSLIYFLYKAFFSRPTCFDHKQNQGEEGVDCGGPCPKICLPLNFRDIETNFVKFLKVNNKIILLAQIQNPNSEVGVSNFDYQFNVLDQNKNIVKTINNSSFIYAEEIKYLTEFLDEKEIPNIASVELKILNPNWTKAFNFRRPDLRLLNKNIFEKDNLINLNGKIINNDFVGFENINILVNFYNQGNWIGSSKTIINNILPQEIKEFNVVFPKNYDFNNLEAEVVIEAKRK
ncbi:MAG: hypothetical protein ACPL3E_01025 [Minisyncoccia bacterium]